MLLGLCVTASSCGEGASVQEPVATRGVLDLSQWDLTGDGAVRLKGEWQFFKDEFVPPSAFDQSPPAGGFIKAPGLWNSYKLRGRPIGPFGYGTYRLLIHLKSSNGVFGLRVPDFACSYRLYVNGRLLCQNGRPGRTRAETVPQWLPKTVMFTSAAPTIDMVVHVANFNHQKGGMWEPIMLGTSRQVIQARSVAVAGCLFLFGTLLVMGLYHIGLFALWRKEHSLLFLGLFCLSIALRRVISGEVVAVNLFPNVPFELLARAEYLSGTLGIPLFTMFVGRLYPRNARQGFLSLTCLVAGVLAAIILLTPLRVFGGLLPVIQVVTILTGIYLLVIVSHAVRERAEGSQWILAGLVILVACVVNDFAYANRWHQFDQISNLIPSGLAIFILCQSFVLALKFSNTLKASESLALELESRVRERTRALEEVNERLEAAARWDAVTSLYNRQEFEKVVQTENTRFRAEEGGYPYSVLYIDLDGFKDFNDTYGHAIGDLILLEFARLVKGSVRRRDNVFRVGGDEFVVLMPGTSESEARATGERIRRELETRDSFGDILAGRVDGPLKPQCRLSCSVGVYCAAASGDFDLNDMLRRADLAMLSAKKDAHKAGK